MFAAAPIAFDNGDAFSCEMSVNVCCRRLNSLSLSVVSCDEEDATLCVLFDRDDGRGGLFSISGLTLSRHSSFRSGFTAALASVDDVDEDADGLASK